MTVGALLSGLVLAACAQVPDLAEPSLVDRPRVLAVIADPPEAAPGQDVALSLVLAEVPDHQVRWDLCAAFFTPRRNNQYGDRPTDQGCGGEEGFGLGEEQTATVPGLLSQELFDNLELAQAVFGQDLPTDAVEAIRSKVGLPILVEARLTLHDGSVLRASKRLLFSERPQPHTNPPAPHFRADDVEVKADPERPGMCVGQGQPLQVAAGTKVLLQPIVDEDEEPWLETYFTLNVRGELVERKEVGFYSWFSTGGSMAEDVTRSPLRDQEWDSPEQPGCYPLWVVVRDGHGGTSACQAELAVGTGECP